MRVPTHIPETDHTRYMAHLAKADVVARRQAFSNAFAAALLDLAPTDQRQRREFFGLYDTPGPVAHVVSTHLFRGGIRGSDGELRRDAAMQQACAALGIACTYKAIHDYLLVPKNWRTPTTLENVLRAHTW